MNRSSVIATLCTLGLGISSAAAPIAVPKHKYPIDAAIPNGIPSVYTERLKPVIKEWPRKEIPTDPAKLTPIWMRVVRNPEQDFHVGIIKRYITNAPLKRVEEAMDDFASYKIVFPTLKLVEITGRDENLIHTRWEHQPPIFFLPNARYEQSYIIDKSNPKRLLYRYQLITGVHVEHTDGFYAIEAIDENRTMLTGYDFFQPDLGPLKVFGAGRVWHDGTEASFKGDMSMKLHIENPKWGAGKIQEEVEKILEKYPVHPLTEIEAGPFAPPPAPKPKSEPKPSVEPTAPK